jgi:hypothetical protein
MDKDIMDQEDNMDQGIKDQDNMDQDIKVKHIMDQDIIKKESSSLNNLTNKKY